MLRARQRAENEAVMSDPTDTLTGKPCPICGKAGLRAFRPFCSRRCADVDLNRWLSGAYVVPGDPATDEDETPSVVPRDEEA
jgi:endogenous inhibitor of DNA gyrase (YacG/DUF329 family)